jgi:hypothetical protein
MGKCGCQLPGYLLERSASVHQFQSPPVHQTLLGKSRDIVGSAPTELCGRQHYPFELRLVELNGNFARFSRRFNLCRPAPEIIILQKFRLKIHANSLTRHKGHRLKPKKKHGAVNPLGRTWGVGEAHAFGQVRIEPHSNAVADPVTLRLPIQQPWASGSSMLA